MSTRRRRGLGRTAAALLAVSAVALLAACGPGGCDAVPWGPPQTHAPAPTSPPTDTAAVQPPPAAAASALVDLADLDSAIRVDMRYAGPGNFMKQAVYPTNRCLLRPETAARLQRVQERLAPAGLGLLVWDCYRPLSVQKRMWELVPDPRYVADPKEGSKHNRGAAVDVTLVQQAGGPMDLGTDHDDFSEKAAREYPDMPFEVKRNRRVLENAMTLEGFLPLPTEWWHFDDPDWQRFPLLDEPLYRPR